ncbi:hypothetical protein BC829DRAFT_442717 [Chytridium lagenaria]|nr:hypothetical protein BC829DRAFT_442717 [Chytridium lagenaria]
MSGNMAFLTTIRMTDEDETSYTLTTVSPADVHQSPTGRIGRRTPCTIESHPVSLTSSTSSFPQRSIRSQFSRPPLTSSITTTSSLHPPQLPPPSACLSFTIQYSQDELSLLAEAGADVVSAAHVDVAGEQAAGYTYISECALDHAKDWVSSIDLSQIEIPEINIPKRYRKAFNIPRTPLDHPGMKNFQEFQTMQQLIVVIGSQSSGRVPWELSSADFTKQHGLEDRSSDAYSHFGLKGEYGEFPQLALQGQTLPHPKPSPLNLAVSTLNASPTPIESPYLLSQHSELTLLTSPYIQIHNRNQPAALKEKIADLLKLTSRNQHYPPGRPQWCSNHCVITKMDWLNRCGVNILTNSDYPLQLGYVGCLQAAKVNSKALFARGLLLSVDQVLQRIKCRRAPFLRRRLMSA